MGGFLFNSIIQSFIATVSVSRAFIYLEIIYSVIRLVGAQLLRQLEKGTAEVSDEILNDYEFIVGQMIKTKTFYLIWGVYLIGTINGLMGIGLTKDIWIEMAQLSPEVAGNAVALAAIFNAIIRIS